MAKAKSKAATAAAPAYSVPAPTTVADDGDGDEDGDQDEEDDGDQDEEEDPGVDAEGPVESKVIERTVVTTTERIYEAPIVPVVPAPPTKAPSIKAPTTKAPTTKAPSFVETVAPTVVSGVDTTVRPPSVVAPPPSVKSISPEPAPAPPNHHPEVVVNVNFPQAAAPPPPPSVQPTQVPLPPSEAGSIIASPTPTDMRLPPIPQILKFGAKEEKSEPKSSKSSKGSKDRYVVPVPLLEEDELDEQNIDEITFEEQGPGEQVITQVVTTTTTRRIPSPSAASESPTAADPQVHFSSYVENDPTYRVPRASATAKKAKKPKAAKAPAVPEDDPELESGSEDTGSPTGQTIVKTVTVETTTYPAGGSIDSAASTKGGATTMGIGGARSAMLSAVGVKKSGTKAGIKPIPYGELWPLPGLALQSLSLVSKW